MRVRRRKARNWTAGILTAALLAAATLGYFEADAATAVDLTKEGSVTISVQENSDIEANTVLLTQVEVKLYRVAKISESGYYTYIGSFGDSALTDPNNLKKATQWDEVKESVIETIDGEKIAPDYTVEIGEGAEDRGYTISSSKKYDNDGKGLELGMYLMVVDPVYSKDGSMKYTFASGMFSLPGNLYLESDSSGEEEDEWKYGRSIYLKPEKEDLTGSLQITKTLNGYKSDLGEVLCVFEVEAREAESSENYYFKNDYWVSFKGDGTKTITISGLKAGSWVTVEEVYSGGSYDIDKEENKTQSVQIVAEDLVKMDPAKYGMATATFVNNYDGSVIGGHGVVNHYENDSFTQLGGTDVTTFNVETSEEDDSIVSETFEESGTEVSGE